MGVPVAAAASSVVIALFPELPDNPESNGSRPNPFAQVAFEHSRLCCPITRLSGNSSRVADATRSPAEA